MSEARPHHVPYLLNSFEKINYILLNVVLDRMLFSTLRSGMDLGITFSLNFKDLLAGFKETTKDLIGALVELFGGTAECLASVVVDTSKRIVSLGWSKKPHPPDQQPEPVAKDEALKNAHASKLGMDHNGQIVREVQVDHAVANFAKRHTTKLGPRARLPWVVGTNEGESATAVLGPRPVLPARIEATDFEGQIGEVEETELGVALRWEHEAHVTAIAAAAAAQKVSGSSGGPAAAVAAHALGVKLDDHGRLFVAPEWHKACILSEDHVDLSSSSDADHCGATAYVAAVACSGAKESKTAFRACAAALSSLASKHCVHKTKRCVAKTPDALSCSTGCGTALLKVSNDCGGFWLRGEHGDHEQISSEECFEAVRGAQDTCVDSAEDATCMSLLEAVPPEEHAAVHGDAADDVPAHIHHRQATLWREQHARGVLPEKHLCQGAGHLDLRDNVLVGSVPACAWALESGRGSLLISRNLLSGNVGKLGTHVLRVHANNNRFTGSLDVAFSEARDLEVFDVAHNQLSGDLGAALERAMYNSIPSYSHSFEDDVPAENAHATRAPLSSLKVLHVEDNELSDTESRPVVHTVLSKMHSLKSYDISGNKFHVSSRPHPAQDHVAVHAVLHIDADARHLCPGVSVEGFAHNCGEMLLDVDKTNMGALDCAVRAAAEVALPDDDCLAVTVHRERVIPFKSEGTVISFTIRVTRSTTDNGNTHACRHKKTVAETILKVRDAISKLTESKDALRAAAAAGGCLSDSVPFLAHFPVKEVDARLGCAPGLHGKGCRYACMGRWNRHDAVTPAPHNYYAEYAPQATHSDKDYVYDKSATTRELITNPEKPNTMALSKAPSAGLGLKKNAEDSVRESRRHWVHHWEGPEHEKHMRGVSLKHCTTSCRGHANRALGTCHEWIDNRGDLMMRRKCAAHLKDMGQMCGVTLRGAKSQCGTYFKPHEQDEEHDCQVCGIHRFFEQHGAYGGGQSHYTTYDFSLLSNGRYTHNAVHLSDTKRRAKAVAEEEAAKYAALGLIPQVPPEPTRSHMAGAAEEYMRAHFAEHAPHEAISRAVNDGVSNALDAPDGEDNDASYFAEIQEQAFGGMTVRTTMDSQFPTCRGDERCSEACVLSTRSAMDSCMEWLHAEDEDVDSAECSKSIENARARCSPEERSRCLEPIVAGFHALGVPGGQNFHADSHDKEEVKKPSRHLLSASTKRAGEMVMTEFPASQMESASYPADDSSQPSPETPVELMAKGKRDFDLVSSVCRPVGITEQDLAMTCMKDAKWSEGGVSRVALGWDNAKTPLEKADARVVEELMDESDAPEFHCNIPYLGLDFNSSMDVELEVTRGHVQCGAVMRDGQKLVYDFYVEARMKQTSAVLSAIYSEEGAGPYTVDDVRVKYHAYGKTKKDIEKEYRLKPSETAAALTERDFASSGYSAEAEFHVLPDASLTDAYNLPSRQMVTLTYVNVEFDGPPHATAPRVARKTATLEVSVIVDGFIFSGEGQLPFPLTGDRPLVASVALGELNLTGHGTLVIYPKSEIGASYATLRAFMNNTNNGTVIAFAVDFKKISDAEISYSGMKTSWDSGQEEGHAESIEYIDGRKGSDDATRGDAFTYVPGGKHAATITLASNKRKAIGCRSVVGVVDMKIGAINPGGEGGRGMLPNNLQAPAWGTMSCKRKNTDPDLVLNVVTARYTPWPDDDAFLLRDVLIKLSVTTAAGKPLNDGNLVGTLQAFMDLSSQSTHGLPPLGGWSKVALTFYAEGGDLAGAYESSSWFMSGVVDSRLGDADRPYARVVAPIEAKLPCAGVFQTVGSVYANIDGIFRLQGENIPINISCGDESKEDENDRSLPSLAASAELDLRILPPDSFKKMIDDGAGRNIPFVKKMKVTVRHVNTPVWFWDGDLVTQIGGETSALKIFANATFRTKNGFPPDAQIGMSLSYENDMFDLYAAGSFPVGVCYDPYRYFGEINIHPPPSSSMGNGSFNMSLTQYCQRGDGTTEYFFTAQITDWEVVPGTFGIPHGLIEGTLIRDGNAGGFKYWKMRVEGSVGLLGASDGKIPDFGDGFTLALKTWFGSEKDELRVEVNAAFQIQERSDSSYFKISGAAEFAYPCVLGDRIGGLVNVSVEIGDMMIPGISGAVFFHCKVNGTDLPILEAAVKTYGVVQFVKGVNLDNFELLFNAYKHLDDKGKEHWLFAGSVSATMAFGDKHGASIEFMFDTRTGSWGAAVVYELMSPNVNLTIQAGVSVGTCKPEGIFLKGAVAVKIGEEGYLYGSARGAKHCGDYRRTKGVINVRAAVDDATIKTNGMILFLENIELKLRGDTRDELITAEGFMQTQMELPVSSENPYFTPLPESGRRKLLDDTDAIDPRVTLHYRTNCFQGSSIFNTDDPNHVLKTMNKEDWPSSRDIMWSQGSKAKIVSVDCLSNVGSGEPSDACAIGTATENDANHPICPEDDSLMSGFMFTRDSATDCKCQYCKEERECEKPCPRDKFTLDTISRGNSFTISYNCLKQPVYATPFGECTIKNENMLVMTKSETGEADLKVLEKFDWVACGENEGFKSFHTTTNEVDDQVMGWESNCCKLPPDAGPVVTREGRCFYTANPSEDQWMNSEKSIILTHLIADKGVSCGASEVLTAWKVASCNEDEFKSRFVWRCRHVGGIQSPPPPAPPLPAPPVDESIENLDWAGNFSGNARIGFGEDLDDDMLSSFAAIFKVNASFSVIDGEFKLDQLLISAAVKYIVPSEKGSWQASRGLNEIEIEGFASLNYPCQSIVDPLTNRPKSLPLFYGEVSAKLALGSESDPVIIGPSNGAKGVIEYHCSGGKILNVDLKVGKVTMESVRLEDVVINITLTQSLNLTGDAWTVAGSVEGKIAVGSDMNKGASDQSQATSISGAYIFDTSVPFFDIAVKLELGPSENFYMALMMRVTRGRCTKQGDYVKGVIEAGGDDFKVSGSLFGNRLCIHPDDPDAVRYNLTLAVEEISFANGLLNISNTRVEAIAHGPYRGDDDYNLTIFDWRINAAADILVNVDADNFALRIHGAAEFVVEMDAITPAENFSVVAIDTKPGVVELKNTKIRASVGFSYGYPGDSFHMNVTARAKFSWPCHTFMTLDGTLKLNFGGDVDFGKMSVGFTLFCHDPDAYSAHSVYTIEVFTDHSLKNQTETLVRDFDDYETFDEIAAIKAAEDAQFAPPPPKEARCEHSAQEIVADSFWGASNVRTVHSKFQATTELEKAHDHLDSMREVDGYQLCNARIKVVTQEYKQNMIEQMSIFGELNHTEYSALRNNPRMAWELIASLDEPMSFAGGKFTISNILLNLRAYDKEGHRAPAMQKQDLLPDMDLQYYDIYGDFTATTDIDIETDAATASATAMRTSSAALGAFSLEATATLEADLSLIDDQFSFLWNLTVKMEMFVNTSQFYLHMRGDYNDPCNQLGVNLLGIMHVNVPGTIVVDNTVITGTLYCEGHDPRVEAYLGIDSLVLADVLEIEQVHIKLRSVTPTKVSGEVEFEALNWKLNVSGTLRFDKMLEGIPSLSSKDTLIHIHAEISMTDDGVKLDLIIVHFQFDIKYQKMLRVHGGVDFIWPCNNGERISANMIIDLHVGMIDLPAVETSFIYYCGKRHFTQPVWELDLEMLEPFSVQDMFVLTSAYVHLDAYRYKTGGWWHTITIKGATDPNQGKLQFDAIVFVSTKRDPKNDMSRGFSMDADVGLNYTTQAFAVRAKGRIVLSDSCDSMHLSGTLTIPAISESSSRTAARLGGASDTLLVRAKIELPCATLWVDQTADPTDALSPQSTPYAATMKVQRIIIEANVDEWTVGAFRVTNAALLIDASVRTDGSYIAMANVSGTFTIVTSGADSFGPSSLDGEGVMVNIEAALSLGQTTFCLNCELQVLTVDVDVGVVVKQSSLDLKASFSYGWPCTLGDVIIGQADMIITSGAMVLPMQTTIKYFCGDIFEGSPRMTFSFFASRGKETSITDSIRIKDLTAHAALYISNKTGWDVSGSIEGLVIVDTADAQLGLRERTWQRMLENERRLRPELGVVKHRMFPSDPYLEYAHLSSGHDQPAHLGLVLTTSFFFDTRPEPPLFNVTVALDDLVFGCITISLRASASTCTDANPSTQAISVTGIFKFSDCDGINGQGQIVGKIGCDDGGAHHLYSLVIESKSLKVKDLIVSDVWISATGIRTIVGDGITWMFDISASFEYKANQGPKVPSLGVKAKLGVSAAASLAPVNGFMLEKLKIDGMLDYSNENIKVVADFSYNHPCQPGAFGHATIRFDMKMSTVEVEGLIGTAEVFCDPPEGSPALSLFVGMERLQVGAFSVSEVKMYVDMYTRMKIVEPDDGDVAVDAKHFFKGSVAGKASVEGIETSVIFSFDTDARTFHVMANLTINVDPVKLVLQVAVHGENGCDAVSGNFIDGKVTVKLTPNNTLTASVRGAKHCPSHPQMMHALGKMPPAISPKFNEIAEFLDPGRVRTSIEIELERRFPMTTIHGIINRESRTEIAPGLYIESATISLYNYTINNTDYWTVEITGMVSFDLVNPVFSKKESNGSGGIAAELYFAFAALVADVDGMHNVRIGVTASVDASFGASPQIAIKGRMAFAHPCVNIKGDLMLSFSDLGAGISKQSNIRLNATARCNGDKTPHLSVLAVQGALVGALYTEMFTITDLNINGSLHNNAESNGVYFAGHVQGALSSTTAIDGFKIAAQLDINSSLPLFVINVKIRYESHIVDLYLQGSIQLPLLNCKGADAFFMTGTVVVHLGAAGNVTAHAHAAKKCGANATAIYGHAYHIFFEIESTLLNIGDAGLRLDEVKANFYAKIIGSDSVGGEGTMSWFGALNASVSLALPGFTTDERFNFHFAASFIMKKSTMALGIDVGFSYDAETVTIKATGRIAMSQEEGEDELQFRSVSADGTFSIKMGSDIDVTLHAHFSLKMKPDDDGRDMKVLVSSGNETIKVGGVDLGTFSISADRYQAVDGKKEGWKGLLTSDSEMIDAMVAFDTRDGTFAVLATVTLELGPVILTLEAGHDCAGDKGATQVGVSAVLKDFPKAKLVGEYRKYCGDNDHGLEWSVEAGAKSWEFDNGITLRDVSVIIDQRKVGSLLVSILATVDFSAGKASPMPLPSLTADITIEDGTLSMKITGDLEIALSEHITLTGNVSFVFPCDPQSPTTVQLGIEIDSNEIKLEDAFVRGEWYCLKDGVEPPLDTKLSEYTAEIGLIQVGGFGLSDVRFNMYNTQREKSYKGQFEGTLIIIPEVLSISVKVPFGKHEVATYKVSVDSAFKIKDVNVKIKGYGELTSPCKNMGDLLIQIDIDVTNIPVDWMPQMSGRGRFESNCGDEYLISITVETNKVPQLSVGGKAGGLAPEIPPGAGLTFSVHVKGKETTFQLSFVIELDTLPHGKGEVRPTLMVYLEVLVHTQGINVGLKIEGVNFGQLFSSVGKAVPGSGVEKSSPVEGASASAQGAATVTLTGALGELTSNDEASGLGGFTNMVNEMFIPKAVALFSMLPDERIALVVSLYGVKLFGLSLEIFVNAIKDSTNKWKCFVYIGFLDISGGYLDFPQPWTFLSLIINSGIFLLGGGLTKFGFAYSTDDILLPLETMELCPVRTTIMKSGFGLIMAQDLEGGAAGIGSLFMHFNDAIAGDCKEITSALQQLVCDDMENLDMSSYPTNVPVQGGISFEHTYASKNGVLMTKETDKNRVLWKQLTVAVEVSIETLSLSLKAEVVSEVTFDNEKNIVSEAKARIAIKLSITALELELALAMKLKSEMQIWANPFGSLPHMGIIFPLSIVVGIKIDFTTGMPSFSRFELEAGILGCATPLMYKGKKAVTARLGAGGEYEYVPDKEGERMFNRALAQEEKDAFIHEAEKRATLGFLDMGGGGDNEEVEYEEGSQNQTHGKTIAANLTIAGLQDYSCSPGDYKGTEPTVIKIAMAILFGAETKFALMMIIRNFHISRLVFMTLKGPPGHALMAMAPVLDIFTAKKFDVSINSEAYPYVLYSGTVIQAGILIDIENVAIFGIPIIRRAYIRYSLKPTFLLEAHIYIEPIRLAPLIEITGIQGKQKYRANAIAAKANKEAAEKETAEAKKGKILEEKALKEAKARIATDKAAAEKNATETAGSSEFRTVKEAKTRIATDKAAAEKNATETAASSEFRTVKEPKSYLINSSWTEYDTICGNEKCFTCGRAEEGSGMLTLECAGEVSN